jgi:transcription antitermination factor NusG
MGCLTQTTEYRIASDLALSADPGHAWYALYTRHQHEKNVARTLEGKGLEVFLPLYTAIHRWKDRNKQLLLPLFPGYVFVRNPQERWQPILATPGVYSVVGFSRHPSMIPWSELQAIRRVVGSDLAAEPHPFLVSGARVRLKAGPLQGMEGILIRRKTVWKFVVSIEMLQRSVAVEVDASTIEAAAGSRLYRSARFAATAMPLAS